MEQQNAQLRDPVILQPEITDSAKSAETPVLVAVDFSPASVAALTWACNYAKTAGARLEILHVIHDPGDSPGAYRPDGEDPLEPIADIAKRKLERFVADLTATHPDLQALGQARPLCVEGLPVATILEIAEAHQARLLVLGNSRRNGISRFMHPSTAQQVAGRAKVPVTIINSEG